MRILVTGSAGHLGEALMRMLPAAGHDPIGLDIEPGPHTDIVGSITDREVAYTATLGVDAILHTATLHKPHVKTHSKAAFVETNVAGTLALLEAAAQHRIARFVFTSTTSAFGAALNPAADEPAAWIDESVAPVPKNIYGVTKTAAEDLCALFAREKGMAVTVLRTSRFFPEDDDDAAVRSRWSEPNIKANEFLYRRVDIEDAAAAHLSALGAGAGFARYVISAPAPFAPSDAPALRRDPHAVVARLFPDYRRIYDAAGWEMLDTFDRVYDSRRAVAELGWRPRWDFAAILRQVEAGAPIGSDLARSIGRKGYHDEVFAGGPFPV
ncbi:NAD(P)-dependent oxidoreductase [Acuticoccus sp. I52.16.1]|uniref:NAD-dependent epimerase/dehydratase family protein n=1 Tax=Acuticoccus sp. I52.16.1 TaxID=2928472 RepID=UPI001FD30D0A|nr:NAD(P)-dependent oxidoreductase [Acuticoccus sp. I52.16.1]UOM33695.1 NAD(P)-dependent oxidoreductase [Acuticoccus sp. I52.16.1]